MNDQKINQSEHKTGYTESIHVLKKWQYPFTKLYWWCLWLRLLEKINPKTITQYTMYIDDNDPIMDLIHDPTKDKKRNDV